MAKDIDEGKKPGERPPAVLANQGDGSASR